MKIAAIDIGANSVHLVISRLHGPGSREVLDRERERCCGWGIDVQQGRDHARADGPRDRGPQALPGGLGGPRRRSDPHGRHCPVRDARNRAEFVVRAKGRPPGRPGPLRRGGRPPDLRRRPGRAVALDQEVAVLDIGGGSAEIVVGEGSRSRRSRASSSACSGWRCSSRGRRGKTLKDLETPHPRRDRPVAREVSQAGVDAAVGPAAPSWRSAELLDVRDEGHPSGSPSSKSCPSAPQVRRRRTWRSWSRWGEARRYDRTGLVVVRVFMEEAGP